jgi:hypothetical protein
VLGGRRRSFVWLEGGFKELRLLSRSLSFTPEVRFRVASTRLVFGQAPLRGGRVLCSTTSGGAAAAPGRCLAVAHGIQARGAPSAGWSLRG